MNTLVAVADGLTRYLAWWLMALVRWRDPCAPMSARRMLVLVCGFPVFFTVQLGHAICLILDEVLFPAHRRVSLHGTVIITGIPRSGTTFLHRTLALASNRFTTVTTWEAVLAPSLLQRHIVGILSRLDRCIGRPGGRTLGRLTRGLTGAMADVHEVGLDAAEEDYLWLLPAGGCFIMLLAFPGASGLQALGSLNTRMPTARRRRLLRFYRGCLQRHRHYDPSGRALLSKNAAFGSWLRGLHETIPEARFIVCIREPEAALSSQISSVRAAKTLFGTATTSAALQRLFLDIYARTLGDLASVIAGWPVSRVAVIDARDLAAQPAASVRAILARFGIDESARLSTALGALDSTTGSAHRHSIDALALDQRSLEQAMRPQYEELCSLPHRTGAAS